MTPPSQEHDDAVGEAPTCSQEGCRTPVWLLAKDEATGRYWCRSHDPRPEIAAQRRAESERGGMATARRFKKYLDPGEIGDPKTPEEIAAAYGLVTEAVGTGRVTAQMGQAMIRGLDGKLKALQAAEQSRTLQEVIRLVEAHAANGGPILQQIAKLVGKGRAA